MCDDWNAKANGENKEGCYRFHPDLSDKKYFGEEMQWMLASSKDGYLYYQYNPVREPANNIINDLRQCNPDGSNIITLFYRNMAPSFEDSNYTSYSNIEVAGEYVYIGVDVQGYSTGDSWRGHKCYYGYYRICKDGSGLELLCEDKTLQCPSLLPVKYYFLTTLICRVCLTMQHERPL